MAASDLNPRSTRPPTGAAGNPTTNALRERLEEEIDRAERHGTELSCLLLVIENLDEMTQEHGSELREQTLDYVADALRRELRRFDRVGRAERGERDSDEDLLIILPGADSPRAEIVARRALDRLRAIKVEARGARWPLHVSVGLAAWRVDVSAQSLLALARAAVHSPSGEDSSHGFPGAPAQTPGSAAATRVPPQSGLPPALGDAESS